MDEQQQGHIYLKVIDHQFGNYQTNWNLGLEGNKKFTLVRKFYLSFDIDENNWHRWKALIRNNRKQHRWNITVVSLALGNLIRTDALWQILVTLLRYRLNLPPRDMSPRFYNILLYSTFATCFWDILTNMLTVVISWNDIDIQIMLPCHHLYLSYLCGFCTILILFMGMTYWEIYPIM